MAKEAEKHAPAHACEIALFEPAPSEVPVGADFVVRLVVSCAAGCDLAGAPIEVTGFVRYALGEGIERKDNDFASEVAAAAGQ